MFSTINILLNFLMLKIVNGQQQVRYGGKYRRNEELSNTPPDHKPQLMLHPSGNGQLLVPADPSHINKNGDDVQQIPPAEDSKLVLNANPNPDSQDELKSKQTPFHNKLSLSLYKVNYMQEKTASQWPRGFIPYFIDTESYDPTTIRRIVKTMGIVESSSCVIFKELERKPLDSNDTWLHITNPGQERECVHKFSPDDAGGTVVVLGFECLHPDEILHSLLHAIGLKDEVTHPHRDQYIRILWENIQPKYRPLFRIQFKDAPYKLVDYDPMSIMHFHDRAFSANGAATISPVISGQQIGPAHRLSPLDIMKLKLAFGHECNKRKIGNLIDTCKNALSPKTLGKIDNVEKFNEKDNNMNLNAEVQDEASTKHLNAEDNTERVDTQEIYYNE